MEHDALLMRSSIEIYNNIATFAGVTGRLSLAFNIQPTPRLTWVFEVLDDTSIATIAELELGATGTLFDAKNIRLDGVILTDSEWKRRNYGRLHGIAHTMTSGNETMRGNWFAFLLPNTAFLNRCLRQELLEQTTKGMRSSEIETIGTVGRRLRTQLDSEWEVQLTTGNDALEWLDPKHFNTGTLLTSVGYLYRTHGGPSTNMDPTFSHDEATSYLNMLCKLLAFANGGYTSPLYLLGRNYDFAQRPINADEFTVIYIGRVSTIEHLVQNWLGLDSDLGGYIQCFSTFRKMVKEAHWSTTYDLVLAWYFQAIQPQDAQRTPKYWQVRANALAAALELLAYTILVLEENDVSEQNNTRVLFSPRTQDRGRARNIWNLENGERNRSVSSFRINLLLERIGLHFERGYDERQHVDAFIRLRNDATHAIARENHDEAEIIIERATQWLEEIMLWRLGYDGKYLERSELRYQTRDPRYDLTKRNRIWDATS